MIKEFSKDKAKTPGISVIRFGSVQCGPCASYKPVFNEFAQDIDVPCFEFDITPDNANVAVQYGIRALPSTIILANGECVNRIAGVLTKVELVSAVDAAKEQLANQEG